MLGRFFDPPVLHQQPRGLPIDLPAVGIELKAAADFSLRSLKIALFGNMAGAHAVRRGERRIELQCFFRGRQPVIDIPAMMITQTRLGDGEQPPGLCVTRIEIDCSLRRPNDNLIASDVAIIARNPELSGHQIEIVGIDVRRAALLDRLLLRRQQLHLQRIDYRLGNLVLDGENVGQVAVEPFRPKMLAGRAVDQLGGDP